MLADISIDDLPEQWHPSSDVEAGVDDEKLREMAEEWWVYNSPPDEFADIRALTMEEFVDAVLQRAA